MRIALLLILSLTSFGVMAGSITQALIEHNHRALSINNSSVVIDGRSHVGVRQGDGEVVTEKRALPPFSSLQILIPARVVYRTASQTGLILTADSNLMAIIETEVVGETLKISASEGYSTDHPIDIRVSSAALLAATLQGGALWVEGVDGPSLDLAVMGAGDIWVSGRVRWAGATVQGSGSIDASRLISDSCRLSVQGSGEVRAHCADTLSAAILGSGDIRVVGAPELTSISELGAGRVLVD